MLILTRPMICNMFLLIVATSCLSLQATELSETDSASEAEIDMAVQESMYLNVNVADLLASETGPLIISIMSMDHWLSEMGNTLGEDWLLKVDGVSVMYTNTHAGNPTLMVYGRFDDEDQQRLITLMSESGREMTEFNYRQRPYLASSWQPELLQRHRQLLQQIERSDVADLDRLYEQMQESAYQLTAFAFGPQGIMISSDMLLVHHYVDTGSQPDENWRVRNQGLMSLTFDRERVIADLDKLWDVDPDNFSMPIFDYFESVSLTISEQQDTLYVHADLEATDLASADLIHNLAQGWLSMVAFQTDHTALTQEWLSQVRIQQQGTTLGIDLNPRLDLLHELAEELLFQKQQAQDQMDATIEEMAKENGE